MNKKKIIMVILLILVIGGIVFAIIKINNKSSELANKQVESQKIESSIKAGNIIEITDNYFIEQTNDIYINTEDYIGKTVKFEGLVYSYEDEEGNTYYAVVRNTPGCCGNDGLAGIDIRYDKEYPEVNTWVEVEGVIEEETVDKTKIPAVKVSSMKEKEEGTTFVTN